MAVLALDHVQLAMPSGGETQARDFYVGLLGFNEVAKPAALSRRGGCWFECGTVKLHLGVEAEFRPARKAHPAFLVDDLEATMEPLLKAGGRATHDTPLDGIDRLFVDDPFGNRIELMQRK